MHHEGLQIAQDRETPVQVERSGAFSWRYAYARSADTRKVGDPGQDYLTFRHEERTFAFVLCDGVSQSFFGDLAARFLGNGLLDWLWQDLPAGMDTQEVYLGLVECLDSLSVRSRSLVTSHPLPEDIPQMLREVLEQKRAIGSETTFACGRLDLPGLNYPDGRVTLAWMGDSRLRLWGWSQDDAKRGPRTPQEPGSGSGGFGERTGELGNTFVTEQRWSTHRGPVKGKPHLLVAPIQNGGRRQVTQLMVYSDGLSVVDGYSRSPSNKELNGLIDAAAETAVSDDISFLEIWLEKEPAGGKNGPGAKPALASTQEMAAPAVARNVNEAEPVVSTASATNGSESRPRSEPAAAPRAVSEEPGPDVPGPTGRHEPARNRYLLVAAIVIAIILIGALIAFTFMK